MTRPLAIVALASVAASLTAPLSARAQATRISAPDSSSAIASVPRFTGRSSLPDLRASPMATDDIELRVWGIAGISRPQWTGVVLRRESGTWRGWGATEEQCARSACHAFPVATGGVDSLVLHLLPTTAAYAATWNETVAAGVLRLAQAPAQTIMIDGSTTVIEVRRGSEYRAAVMAPGQPVFAGVLSAVGRICPDHTTTPFFPKYCMP